MAMERLRSFEDALTGIGVALEAARAERQGGAQDILLTLITSMFDILKTQFMSELTAIRTELEGLKMDQATIVSQADHIDRLETYTRRQCILIHGVPETAAVTEDDCMQYAVNMIRERLAVNIPLDRIDRAPTDWARCVKWVRTHAPAPSSSKCCATTTSELCSLTKRN
uniref:Uncharacterized protein n=1 Tax=Cacopsylla melanoneura TaxID=428564 RepID=A0A8D8X659_9HEMI